MAVFQLGALPPLVRTLRFIPPFSGFVFSRDLQPAEPSAIIPSRADSRS